MFLILEILFIVLLVMVLFMVYKGERLSGKSRASHAIVEEYWDGKDRREHVRFEKTLEVDYAVRKKPHLASNGKTVDISEGGMKLLMDAKLPVGTILDLRVELPNSKKISEVEGTIVWCDEVEGEDASGKRFFHSGIKFSAIKEPSGKHLIDYIRSIASNSSS